MARLFSETVSQVTSTANMPIYLYRDAVDFRKSINGLATIVEQELARSPFDPELFLFCNKSPQENHLAVAK